MLHRLAALLLSVVWLGGCAIHGSDEAVSGRDDVGPIPTSTLVVATTYRHDNPWVVYREGARAELILRDATGEEVARRTVKPGWSVRFEDLPPGEYRLDSALRPCDGNCGHLDARLDDCSGTVVITRGVRIRVGFVVGAACTVRGPEPAVQGSISQPHGTRAAI